jgi:hypothetical protein
MNEDEIINDTRCTKSFQHVTFCNFKRSDVKKEFLKALNDSKIEAACYWSAEMICSGYLDEVWDCIIHYYSKNIHLGNVKMIILISKRLDYFKQIVSTQENDLAIRNNPLIRSLFGEMVSMLCLSKKKNSYNSIEIKKTIFDISELKDSLKAPNVSFSKNVIKSDEDSNELLIPVNELSYCLSSNDTIQCFFWIEWLLEYESRCIRKKEKLKIGRRLYCKEDKYQKDIAWLIWDCLHASIDHVTISKVFVREVFKSCINLFQLHYNNGKGKKRKFLFFFMCSIITEPFDTSEKLVSTTDHLEKIQSVTSKIHSVYKQIKKNEMFSNLEYLIAPIKQKSNHQSSMDKMEKLFHSHTTHSQNSNEEI